MKWLLLLLAFCLTSGSPSWADESFTYSNPLDFSYTEGQTKPQREVRDPCIIREGDTYYLVFTMAPFAGREDSRMGLPDNGSSPGIALYSSKDLKGWKFENWLVKSSDLPENCPYKHRFWAPEIHKIKGKFYLIFTADNWIKPEYNAAGNWGRAGYAFVGVADQITGPYHHIVELKGAGCDTSLFVDDDGKTYAVIPRGNIDLREIDLTHLEQDQIALVGPAITLVKPRNDDIGSPNPTTVEGPWLEKINGVYTLIYAALYKKDAPPDWQGYWVGVAYAPTVAGPYRKDSRGKIFLGGHAAIFTGPDGGKWISYRNEERGHPARSLLSVEPFRLDASGKVCPITPTAGNTTVSTPSGLK